MIDKFTFYKKSKLNGWLVAGVACISLFHLLAVYYADIIVYARFGLTFLDSVFDGEIFSFYRNAAASGIAPEGAVYDIGLYLVYGIWNIPLWVMDKLVGIDPVGVGALLWYKVLLIVFQFVCMVKMYDIGKLLGLSEKETAFAAVCFSASLLVFMPIYVASQCDVIPLAFLLSALYHILSGNRKKMLFYIAIALLTKPFSLLMLVLLVVLYEKNIFKILWQLLLGVFPMLSLKILYSMVPGAVKSSETHIMLSLDAFLSAQIPSGNAPISLFVVGYMVLVVIAYLSQVYIVEENQSKELQYFFRRRTVIYLFFMWLNFCIVAGICPYWAIYLAPFAIWVMLFCKDVEKAMLLELGFEIGLTAILIMNFSWVYGGEKAYTYTMLSGIIKNIVETKGGVTVAGMLRHLKFDMLLPAISAVTTVCAVAIGVLAIKDNCETQEAGKEESNINKEKVKLFNIQYALRFFVIGIWLLLSLTTFVVPILGYS